MTDKDKRKVNPRHRLLIRLIVGMVLLAALISAAIYALQPKGAQIVFIAPDDEGIDQIWLANLNDPEHPKQLTFFEDERGRLQIIGNSTFHNRLLLGIIRDLTGEYILLNIGTSGQEVIHNCEHPHCIFITFSPDGDWFTYGEQSNLEHRYDVYTYNLSSSTRYFIDNISYQSDYQSRWSAENTFIYPRDCCSSMFYAYHADSNYVEETALNFTGVPFFSNDGSHLATTPYDSADYFSIEVYDSADTSVSLLSLDMYAPIDLAASNDNTLPYSLVVRDWHPDNRHILVYRVWNDDDVSTRTLWETNWRNEILLYDINTGDGEILFEPESDIEFITTFNYDGSQILYTLDDWQNDIHQIMLYDMETREEIALPLFGHSPQWVNGGR